MPTSGTSRMSKPFFSRLYLKRQIRRRSWAHTQLLGDRGGRALKGRLMWPQSAVPDYTRTQNTRSAGERIGRNRNQRPGKDGPALRTQKRPARVPPAGLSLHVERCLTRQGCLQRGKPSSSAGLRISSRLPARVNPGLGTALALGALAGEPAYGIAVVGPAVHLVRLPAATADRPVMHNRRRRRRCRRRQPSLAAAVPASRVRAFVCPLRARAERRRGHAAGDHSSGRMIGSAYFATWPAICTPAMTFGSHEGVDALVVIGTPPTDAAAASWLQ